MDSGDSNDRIDDLEQELHELKQQMHVEPMPEPGLKGWLRFQAIGNVVAIIIMGFATLASLTVPPVALFIVPIFCYMLYVVVIFFQHKKSTQTHMKILIVLGLISNVIEMGVALSGRRPEEAIFGLVGLIVGSLWLAYWNVSKRVKVTFVK